MTALQRRLIIGFYATSIPFVTLFAILFFVIAPETFANVTVKVFAPIILFTDFLLFAGAYLAYRGNDIFAANFAMCVTASVVFCAIALTGGFPCSVATPMSIVVSIVLISFLGAKRGVVSSLAYFGLLMVEWLAKHLQLITLPDFTTGNPELNALIVISSAATLSIVFMAFVETENAKLRENLMTERDHMAELAERDGLTGLTNARAFHEHLETRAINHAERDACFGLFYLDLDGFKQINDTYGHGAGDAVLKAVANRLLICIDEGSVVARLGGDEFAIVIPKCSTERQVEAKIEHLRIEITKPVQIAAGPVQVGTSIGYAVWPLDAEDKRGLLHIADSRMYLDKVKKHKRRMADVIEPSTAEDVVETKLVA